MMNAEEKWKERVRNIVKEPGFTLENLIKHWEKHLREDYNKPSWYSSTINMIALLFAATNKNFDIFFQDLIDYEECLHLFDEYDRKHPKFAIILMNDSDKKKFENFKEEIGNIRLEYADFCYNDIPVFRIEQEEPEIDEKPCSICGHTHRQHKLDVDGLFSDVKYPVHWQCQETGCECQQDPHKDEGDK